MEFIKNHKKALFVGSFLAVIAYGLYTLKQTHEKEEQMRLERKRRRAVLRKRRRAAEKKKQQSSLQKSKDESLGEASIRSDSVYKENNITTEESRILESITKSIVIKYHEKKRNQLTFEAISDIFENAVLLKHKEYELVIRSSRTVRRPLLQKNLKPSYLDQVLKLEEEIDEVLQLGIEAVIGTCNITGDIFQSSIDYINEREETNNKISLLHSAMLQKFKTYLKATKTIDLNKLKQIFHFKIECLTKKSAYFSSILMKIKIDENTVPKLPMIINTILHDLIFEEYGLEEEDILPLLINKDTLKDLDLHNLILGLEQITQQIMDPYLGRIPANIS